MPAAIALAYAINIDGFGLIVGPLANLIALYTAPKTRLDQLPRVVRAVSGGLEATPKSGQPDLVYVASLAKQNA